MPRYNFDKEAETYDNFYKDSPGPDIDLLEKKLVSRFLHYFHKKEILEIGCGTGHWSSFFSDQGFPILGLDISEKMLEKARGKNIPNARFLEGQAENLPFDDHSFLNVACITTLEFVDDREKALNEIDRVLKPGGVLMLGVLNEHSFLGKHKNDFEVFKNARFFTDSTLIHHLSRFGKPKIAGCVVQDDNGNILDLKPGTVTGKDRLKKGAFLAGVVKKII